eukprot:m.117891 g.117891  ORF g.117891 m.117891 type:complete len:125 (-) comp9333_c0_seq5:2511-2885(-)
MNCFSWRRLFSLAFSSFSQQLISERESLVNFTVRNMKDNTDKLKELFDKIDRIEVFVNHVKAKMQTIEAQLSSLEEKKNVMSFFKKASWFGKKKPAQPATTPKLEPVQLWNTSQIFSGTEEEAS